MAQPCSSEWEQLSEIKSNETLAEINSNYTSEGGGGDSAPADPSQIIVEETSRSFQSSKCAHSFFSLLSTWMRSHFAESLNKTRMCLENNKKKNHKEKEKLFLQHQGGVIPSRKCFYFEVFLSSPSRWCLLGIVGAQTMKRESALSLTSPS